MLRVTCPCGKSSKTEDGNAGRRAKCPNCGNTIVFPALPVAVDKPFDAGDGLHYEVHHPVPAAPTPLGPSVSFVTNTVQVAPKARGVNIFGVGSFIFGILGLLICWIPLLNILVIPLSAI